MIDVATVVANLAGSAVVVAAGTLINHRVTAATQGQRLDEHEKKLEEHELLHREAAARFTSLGNDFMPRREAELQYTNMRESQQRTEQYLRYLVLGERPDPPK